MIGSLYPPLVLLAGGLIVPLLRSRLRAPAALLFPVLGLVNLLAWEHGEHLPVEVAGLPLVLCRIDKLSLLFGILFHLAAFLGVLYAQHVRDRVQIPTALLYAGGAVGAVLAGDLATLLVHWEILALTSVFQIWARGTPRSYAAGMRYLLANVASGVLLLAGILLRVHEQGGPREALPFGALGLETLSGAPASTLLILLAFGVKCAFPGLHSWLTDGYPESTPTGAVFLSAFTTKVGVYALARGFAGADVLVPVGCAMAMFPIFYAVIENDLRRVLGYSMINQIGFMVVGVGLGSEIAVNGAVAHAFNDVIFKGLLFMSMGAVLFRTGKMNGSELGGLYKSMPWTAGFCAVGAASISAFPLFSGFVSKSMVMVGAAEEGRVLVWLMLLFASAGVFHHAGIKIPFFAFFAHDSGIRTQEAPWNMRAAMAIAALLCVFNGCFPKFLYGLLPYETTYEPYDLTHVVTQTQLLFFSALAFTALKLTGLYPPELASVNLDADWFLRRPSRAARRLLDEPLARWGAAFERLFVERLPRTVLGSVDMEGEGGRVPRRVPIGLAALLVALILTAYLAVALATG